MLFQSAALFDSMSVGENLAFPLREQGLRDEKEIADRTAEALDMVDLPGEEEKMPADLSGGMRKRVGLARTIIGKPRCILYDEPTTGLDPITALTVDEEIVKLRDVEGVSSIVVTHQLRDAFFIAEHTVARSGRDVTFDRAAGHKAYEAEFIMLRDGRIAFEGTADELRAFALQDEYVHSFLS